MLNKTTELLNERLAATPLQPAKGDDIRSDMTQLGVNYRGSPIVFEEGADLTVIKYTAYSKDSITAALPGDRAPEVPHLTDIANVDNAPINLYSILSAARHSVFIFGDGYSDDTLDALSEVIRRQPESTTYTVLLLRSQGSSSGLHSKFDKTLIDSKGHAYAGYNVNGTCVVIVRPDGVIGGRVCGAAGVEQYFKGIFGV